MSDHCDGRRFHNLGGVREQHRVLALLRWSATRHLQLRRRHRTGAGPQTAHPLPPTPAGALSVTWIGHSTMLVRLDGLTLLTDPIWSERCSPLTFAGPRRHHPPGVAFQSLPGIDVVLISHNHYDHLDLPTVRRLAERDDPLFVVPLGLAAWFRRHRMPRVVELDWWKSVDHGPVRVHAVPAQHFSGRTPWDGNRTLWAGFVVESGPGRFYFAGDTAFGSFFKEIGRRFGPIRLAALPIGAYAPRWFMGRVHISPEDAVQAHVDLSSQESVAIHFGTFRLTDEPFGEPERLLQRELTRRGIPVGCFHVPRLGETIGPRDSALETR
ncbi:MAG: MBL fold metallo-hydrolase [Candidatus Riflebacteria bacterium]|nr:MBL fold metallo-hydrolase [Candidatus Riflebacteria bacterium]